MTTTLTPNDLGELKTKQQATWASGNYAVIGTTLQIIGEELAEAVDHLRDGDAFGPEVTPPASATRIERLAAFTGRQI